MADQPAEPTGPDLSKGVALIDIPDGGILAGHVDGTPILLSRFGDEAFAVNASCTHYHGPLADGLVRDGNVHCPWHHACFSLRTGEAIRAPAFDSLETYSVTIKNGTVTVGAAVEPKPAAKLDAGPQKIVIVGGGAAAFAAAEALRRHLGYDGALTILSASKASPVDRPNLSKDYLAGTAQADWIPLKSDDFYAEHKIDLRLDTDVADIDLKTKHAVTANGERIPYDALLLATGAEPIHLKTPGFDKPNVYTLRSLADSNAVLAAAKGAKRAAVIGASFIGLEVAASLRTLGLDVHVIAPEEVPLAKILGNELGGFVRKLHSNKGVIFHLGKTGKSFDGRALTLDDGTHLEVDFVVQGVGVKPRTQLAEKIGLKVDNGVLVDPHFRTTADGIFAAGDIARYPDAVTGEPTRIEHWAVAGRQGQVAAANMLGRHAHLDSAPFFWSAHYDQTISYVGHAASWDRLDIEGSVDAGDCTVRYLKNGKLLAVATINRDLDNLKAEAELEAAADDPPT